MPCKLTSTVFSIMYWARDRKVLIPKVGASFPFCILVSFLSVVSRTWVFDHEIISMGRYPGSSSGTAGYCVFGQRVCKLHLDRSYRYNQVEDS